MTCALSRHNFTCTAIPHEIITRFQPRQSVKSLLSLSESLDRSNTNGCAVACIPENLVLRRVHGIPPVYIMEQCAPKAFIANQGESRLPGRFVVRCVGARMYLRLLGTHHRVIIKAACPQRQPKSHRTAIRLRRLFLFCRGVKLNRCGHLSRINAIGVLLSLVW